MGDRVTAGLQTGGVNIKKRGADIVEVFLRWRCFELWQCKASSPSFVLCHKNLALFCCFVWRTPPSYGRSGALSFLHIALIF